MRTPGPWKANRYAEVWTENGASCVAECKEGTNEEQDANAHLIAAAPVMHDDLALISRVCRRFLSPEQCAALTAEEEAAFGRAEDIAEGRS